MQTDEKKLLELRHLSKTFSQNRSREIFAVQDLSLTVYEGECLGIVGESGCGKSTLARLITGLTPATKGRIIFSGQDITRAGAKERRETYRNMQMVFQNPYSAFSPRMPVGTFLAEGLVYFKLRSRREAKEETYRLLQMVELPTDYYEKLPHELSGGELQRVVLARAISVNPRLLILDEPTSALDVSVQSRLMHLLVRLQREHGLTYLFIGHDLALVQSVASRIAVMYAGRVVELLDSSVLQEQARHPYTKELLSSVISVADRGKKKIALRDTERGDSLGSGCPYRARCPHAEARCAEAFPDLTQIASGHFVACNL